MPIRESLSSAVSPIASQVFRNTMLSNVKEAPEFSLASIRSYKKALIDGKATDAESARSFFEYCVSKNECKFWRTQTTPDDSVVFEWPNLENESVRAQYEGLRTPCVSVKSDFPFHSFSVTYNLNLPNITDYHGSLLVSNPDREAFLSGTDLKALCVEITGTQETLAAFEHRVALHTNAAVQAEESARLQSKHTNEALAPLLALLSPLLEALKNKESTK